jgi:hypothetical protein
MTDFAHKSPESALRSDSDGDAPLWRRVLSLPLIAVAALYLLYTTPDALVAIFLEKDRAAILWYALAVVICLAILWTGLRLRRRNVTPQRPVGAL